MHLFWSIVIGIAAGWLSGKIMKGRGFGLLGDLIVGVVGAVVGDVLFGALGLHAEGLLGNLIVATAGAVVLIFAVRIISNHSR
ncbi:GlsB/YeaQ/YmgE family stress response membrane protein [Schlesneria paludicola]|uniref:GlsB/YeaQ/YmgE family stress response membrane protein n=1 Tax=Schlesneria paludicola TaxID=360056 RepID=UPI00029A763B|nr:GlsB/YeaQ/YmgE family stress response membrane protein [Schlesneria paludicola]